MSNKTPVKLKSKFGNTFGFKPTVSPKKVDTLKTAKGTFDPGRFKTQHKG
ncbi:hypothetical protein BH10PAT1_BH10PAT1_3790 [soil metagenome]